MPTANRELPKQLQQVPRLLNLTSVSQVYSGGSWRDSLLKSRLVLALAGLVLLLAACSPKGELGTLQAVLTSDHWMMELGDGMLKERYVYTFQKNGAYKACVFSEFGTRPMKGTWKIIKDKQGRFHLLLENEEAYYFCLWRDSIIQYNKEADTLVVSGPQYAGEKELHRSVDPRGVTNSAPVIKPSSGRCAPVQGYARRKHFRIWPQSRYKACESPGHSRKIILPGPGTRSERNQAGLNSAITGSATG